MNHVGSLSETDGEKVCDTTTSTRLAHMRRHTSRKCEMTVRNGRYQVGTKNIPRETIHGAELRF